MFEIISFQLIGVCVGIKKAAACATAFVHGLCA
jgi:hypothetical protein